VVSVGGVVALTWFLFPRFFLPFFCSCSCQHKSLPTKEVGGIKAEEITAGGAQLNELNGKAEKWFSFVGLAARIFVVFFVVEFFAAR